MFVELGSLSGLRKKQNKKKNDTCKIRTCASEDTRYPDMVESIFESRALVHSAKVSIVDWMVANVFYE